MLPNFTGILLDLHNTSTLPTFSMRPRIDPAPAMIILSKIFAVYENEKHSARDIAPGLGAERFDQAERDRGHHDEARHSRWNDESQQKVGDDQSQENSRIGAPDTQHDHVSQPARDAGARRDDPEQERGEQEPGGVKQPMNPVTV
jgi:hypothetical protein